MSSNKSQGSPRPGKQPKEMQIAFIKDALQDVNAGSRTLLGICIALTSLVFTAMFQNIGTPRETANVTQEAAQEKPDKDPPKGMTGIFPHPWTKASRALWSPAMLLIAIGVTFAYLVFTPIYVLAQRGYARQEDCLFDYLRKECGIKDQQLFDLLRNKRLKRNLNWGAMVFLWSSWGILFGA